MMKTLIALATGLAILAAPAAAAPLSNVGGGKTVAAAGDLPVTTVQSRGKRVSPVGGPHRGGRPNGRGWHNGGGRHHHGGRYYHNRWRGGGGWGRGWGWGGGWGRGAGWGWGGGFYGPRVVVVGAPVGAVRVVKVRRPWTRAWVRSCSSRYRSFNPRTGFYRTYSGRLVFCR